MPPDPPRPDPAEGPPLLLTLAEAAKLLACSRRTLEHMATDGRLRLVRLGGRTGNPRAVRVPRSEVKRLARGEEE